MAERIARNTRPLSFVDGLVTPQQREAFGLWTQSVAARSAGDSCGAVRYAALALCTDEKGVPMTGPRGNLEPQLHAAAKDVLRKRKAGDEPGAEQLADAHVVLAFLTMMNGDPRGAIRHLGDADALRPRHERTLAFRAAFLATQGDYAPALDDLRVARAVATDAHRKREYACSLAKTLRTLGRPDEAKPLMAEYIGLEPRADPPPAAALAAGDPERTPLAVGLRWYAPLASDAAARDAARAPAAAAADAARADASMARAARLERTLADAERLEVAMNALEADAAQQRARRALARGTAPRAAATAAPSPAAAKRENKKAYREAFPKRRYNDDLRVDPRSLTPWRGRGHPNPDPAKADGPLGMAFTRALPLGSLIALNRNNRDSEIQPAAQWLNSLIHLATQLDERKAAHFLLESPDESHALAIHVTDLVPRECPPDLPACTPKQQVDFNPWRPGDIAIIRDLKKSAQYNDMQATVLSAPTAGRVVVHLDWKGERKQLSIDGEKNLQVPAPLLAVRYQANAKGDAQFMKKMKVFKKVMMGGDAVVVKIHAESVAEVEAAVAYLEANRARLSAQYVEEFTRQPHQTENGGVNFRASFLAPPLLEDPVVRTKDLMETCANCNVTRTADAPKFKVCSRCRGAAYCSSECQTAHWKGSHKRVCGKGLDELRDDSASAARPSALVSLIPDEKTVGMAIWNASFQGGPTPKSKTISGHAPNNIHGDHEFIVKVQVPIGSPTMQGALNGAMIYDKERSFQSMVDLRASEDVRRVEALVRGCPETSGMKAYLRARREGSYLRIYTDQRAELQSW